MFRRAVGSLLARATPRTVPARSLHSLRDLALGDGLRGAAGVAAAALFGDGTFAYLKKRTADDESAAKKKVSRAKPPPCTDEFIIDEVCDEKAAMYDSMEAKARFENWMKKFGKTYRDEEEKAMRFQLFKNTVKRLESQPPSSAWKTVEMDYFADFTDKEHPARQPGVDLYSDDYHKHIKELRAKQARGEPLVGW